MKRSRSNRSKNISPGGSTRKQYQPSSVRGLMTSRQQSIKTSSQSEVSGYTQKTQKTNSFVASQDFENVDYELQKQQMRQVFVSEQEQKVIQKILQIARKGKINQKNAFQIPLKVLDNQNVSIGQAKFWKFAAQLLGASINIYEKRIENTWISTNLIHDKLGRMMMNKNKDDQSQEVDQNSSKPITPEFLMMSIQQFRDSKVLDNIKLGEETLEDPQKINITNLKKQFADDPLFKKKLKTFDNTSVKGLLLNVFDLSSKCEIQLFSEQNKLIPKNQKQITKNQYNIPHHTKLVQQSLKEATQILAKHSIFSNIIGFKKQNIVSKNEDQQQQVVDSIGFIRYENAVKTDPMLEQFEALMQSIEPMNSQMPLYDDFNHDLGNIDSNSIPVKYENEDALTVNSQIRVHSQQKFSQMSQRSEYSPMFYGSEGPYSYSQADKSFHSVMTPWQIQFKQSKLRIKSIKKRGKRQGKKRQKIQPGLIQFDALTVENKKITLKTSKQSRSMIYKKNTNANLIPQQLAIYQKVNYEKISQLRIQANKGHSQKLKQNLPDFLAPDPSMVMDLQVNPNEYQNREYCQNEGQTYHNNIEDILIMNEITHQYHSQNNKYTNIRQTKKQIFEKAKEERELRISEINIEGLSPASILITFLHIAGQKNMIVRNTPYEDDCILSWE